MDLGEANDYEMESIEKIQKRYENKKEKYEKRRREIGINTSNEKNLEFISRNLSGTSKINFLKFIKIKI